MACDRFVYFKKGRVPSKKNVKLALEDYLGAFLTNITWGGGRWNLTLSGSNSFPFRRIEPDSPVSKIAEEDAKRNRWMEVYIDSDNIDVITRQGDEATNALALGFAKLLARYWDGELEDDE
jgi:hypothetical protein